MAFDIETENQQHQAGWEGFCKYVFYSVVLVAATLVLLAIFVV